MLGKIHRHARSCTEANFSQAVVFVSSFAPTPLGTENTSRMCKGEMILTPPTCAIALHHTISQLRHKYPILRIQLLY